MLRKPEFLARFIVAFGIFAALGGFAGGLRLYASALYGVAGLSAPVLTGWHLERRPVSGRADEVWLKNTRTEMKLELGLEKLALGLIPFFSLLAATPGLRPRRFAQTATLGLGGFFLLDLLVVLAYPALVRPGAFADITGTFLGLLTFVGAPVILWFALTYPEMRSVWRFAPGSSEKHVAREVRRRRK